MPVVCWDFDEREWNVGANYSYGRIAAEACWDTTVEHVYETSSWGKPHNGARFVYPEEACPTWQQGTGCCEQVPGVWDMPAYQVRVYTTWAAEWAVQWEAWQQVGVDWSECQCLEEEPADNPLRERCEAPPGICIQPGEWYGRIGEPRYDWVHHFDGWHAMDLRRYGNPTWYYTSYEVVTVGRGEWCEREYRDPAPTDAVRVPVIEVQSVLRDPYVIDDSCPPGYP